MGIADVTNIISDPGSLLSFLTPIKSFIDDVEVDVLRAETLNHKWTVTKRPVEIGLNITDARIKEPDALVLDCILADDELELSISSITSLLDGIQTWRDKRDKLYKLMNKDRVIPVTTPYYNYSSMLITDIRVVRDASTSQGFFFRISLEEVRLVASASSDIDLSQLPETLLAKITGENQNANNQGSKKQKQGKKTPADASPKSQSILAGLVDGFLS